MIALSLRFPPPSGCSHALTYNSEKQVLHLSVWLEGKPRNFTLDSEEELRNPEQLLRDLGALLAQEAAAKTPQESPPA